MKTLKLFFNVRKPILACGADLKGSFALAKGRDLHLFEGFGDLAGLENSFPFKETPDQLRSTIEVKKDMEFAKPMDRLLCGDVGYGKTEVALRAAFKAVMDNKQVAILVPTTLLAEQHFVTF